MKTRVDEHFRAEVAHFRLLYTCEACAHFAPESGACAHGYPNGPHRSSALDDADWLEFCKEFELA